jgi:hypothetical protein
MYKWCQCMCCLAKNAPEENAPSKQGGYKQTYLYLGPPKYGHNGHGGDLWWDKPPQEPWDRGSFGPDYILLSSPSTASISTLGCYGDGCMSWSGEIGGHAIAEAILLLMELARAKPEDSCRNADTHFGFGCDFLDYTSCLRTCCCAFEACMNYAGWYFGATLTAGMGAGFGAILGSMGGGPWSIIIGAGAGGWLGWKYMMVMKGIVCALFFELCANSCVNKHLIPLLEE